MTVNLETELIRLLACPECGGTLRAGKDDLVCDACQLHYPVRDGIPILLTEAATDGERSSEYARHTETETESINFYDDFYRDFNDYRRFQRADVDFTKKLFRRLELPPTARVLDLGSGTGYFHGLIEGLTGHEVYSADFSFEGFRAAREQHGLGNLVVMDAYRSAFLPDTFDVVSTIGLTPFKKSEQHELAELVDRVVAPLRSGGYYVFVWSTNLSGRIEKAEVTATDGQQRTSTYYNHTRRSIRQAFEATGRFREVGDYGGLLLTRANTYLTELVMRFVPSSLSARLVVVGRKA